VTGVDHISSFGRERRRMKRGSKTTEEKGGKRKRQGKTAQGKLRGSLNPLARRRRNGAVTRGGYPSSWKKGKGGNDKRKLGSRTQWKKERGEEKNELEKRTSLRERGGLKETERFYWGGTSAEGGSPERLAQDQQYPIAGIQVGVIEGRGDRSRPEGTLLGAKVKKGGPKRSGVRIRGLLSSQRKEKGVVKSSAIQRNTQIKEKGSQRKQGEPSGSPKGQKPF